MGDTRSISEAAPSSSATWSWSPLAVLRPNVAAPDAGEVELSDAVLQKRVRFSKEAALALIARSNGGEDDPRTAELQGALAKLGFDRARDQLDAGPREGIQHWEERGWGSAALDFYLWSRRWDFYDNGADWEEKRDQVLKTFFSEEKPPAPRRAGPDARRLSAPDPLSQEPLGEVLRKRESTPAPRGHTLAQSRLSGLLHEGFAHIRRGPRKEGRSEIEDSLGRIYEVFLAVFDVEGIEPGIYFYDVDEEALELVRPGVFRTEVQTALAGQVGVATSSATFFVCVEFKRLQWRYRHERVYRLMHLNAGRLLNHAILVATAYGLRTMLTPAVRDPMALELLGLDADAFQVVHTLAIG